MKNRRIGVLMGGLSSERSVSLASGEAVTASLLRRGYDAVPIFVDRDIDQLLRQSDIEVAFIALHGRYGEDGCIQGVLETLGIPYTGSDVLSSALAMHKVRAKQLFRFANLPTPTHYVLRYDRERRIVDTHGDFGFPVVVKPISEGSSVGVTIARNVAELEHACEQALLYDDEVLVERMIKGQEISVAVLEGRSLGAVEIRPTGELFDYEAKYQAEATAYFIPPRLSPERYRGVMAQAAAAHTALGCSGATRVDMILASDGNEYILEINTVPGLTETSLLPKIAEHSGLAFDDLIEAMLQGARLSLVDRGGRDRRVHQRIYPGDERREHTMAEHH